MRLPGNTIYLALQLLLLLFLLTNCNKAEQHTDTLNGMYSKEEIVTTTTATTTLTTMPMPVPTPTPTITVTPQQTTSLKNRSATSNNNNNNKSTNKKEFKSCGINATEQCVPYELCNEGMTIAGKFYVDRTRSLLDEACHYMEKCCEIEETLPTLPSYNHTLSDYRTCGERLDDWIYLRPLGYKQKEAKFAEFPWIVGIFTQTDGVYACSGALITAEIAITAAHCVAPVQLAGTSVIVRAGEWDAYVELEPLAYQQRNVKEIIIHSNYTKTPVMHNLALLWLMSPFHLAPHIQTICLPAPLTNFNYSQCYVSGWDRQDFDNAAHKEIMLKKMPMFALPNDQCAAKIRLAILGRRYTLHDSFICTGGDKHDYICRSGGMGAGGIPLVCAMNGCGDGDRFFLAGLLARGARCDGTQLLGIYTNIKYYRAWIDLKLRERNLDIRYYMI